MRRSSPHGSPARSRPRGLRGNRDALRPRLLHAGRSGAGAVAARPIGGRQECSGSGDRLGARTSPGPPASRSGRSSAGPGHSSCRPAPASRTPRSRNVDGSPAPRSDPRPGREGLDAGPGSIDTSVGLGLRLRAVIRGFAAKRNGPGLGFHSRPGPFISGTVLAPSARGSRWEPEPPWIVGVAEEPDPTGSEAAESDPGLAARSRRPTPRSSNQRTRRSGDESPIATETRRR